jgi:hypothetical protein
MKWFNKKDEPCKHKYEARYDEVPNDRVTNVKGGFGDEVRSAIYYKVYVKDVCVKCGSEIKR